MSLQDIKGAKSGVFKGSNKPKMAIMTKIVSNPETGESIDKEYKIHYKTKIPLDNNWIKLFQSSLTIVNRKDYLGYIHILAFNFLDYETNRLRIKGESTPAKKRNFISVLGKSDRTISRFLSYCRKHNAIIKSNGWYYINPLICLKGKYIATETVKIFLNIDPRLRSKIKINHLMMIDTFKKLINEN